MSDTSNILPMCFVLSDVQINVLYRENDLCQNCQVVCNIRQSVCMSVVCLYVCVVLILCVLLNVNAAALAEKLEQLSEMDEEKLILPVLKDAIINCRQNESYLQIIRVNTCPFFCFSFCCCCCCYLREVKICG